jgi:hypothetical protein
MELDASGAQQILGEQEVLGACVPAQGDHGVVLKEQQGVGDGRAFPFLDQIRLKGQAGGIGDATEVADLEGRRIGACRRGRSYVRFRD